ncbi:hypothetical protein OAT16_06090 [Prolixibacteraceae bacterium]|nr:hypothetical protein [Prolixibacteraceae bacterium]
MRRSILLMVMLWFPFLLIGNGFENFDIKEGAVVWQRRYKTSHSLDQNQMLLQNKFRNSRVHFLGNIVKFHCDDVYFDYKKTTIPRSKCPVYLLHMKGDFDVEIIFEEASYEVIVRKVDFVEFKSILSLNHNYHPHVTHHSLEQLAVRNRKGLFKKKFEKYASVVMNDTLTDLFDLTFSK